MLNNPLEAIKRAERIPLGKLKLKLKNFEEDESFLSCDENLMKFLYSRRLSVGRAYTLIENHLRYRRENPEIFENLSIRDPQIRCALENSLPGLLPQTDRKCRTIIVFHANNWDGQISMISIYRALILCLDFALQNVHVQNNGFVIIVNWEQFTFKKSTWIRPKIMRNMIYGLQECYPVKILELHFIASPWYINTTFNVFKLYFDEDMRENFYVHGRNLSTLHEFIHKEVLPTELGGSLPSYNCAKLIEDLEKYCEK